jgi:hypothetical protein
LTYDGWGRLLSQNEKTNYKDPIADRRRYYAYNGDGSVQMRREGTINLDTGAFEQQADSNGAKPNYLFVHAAGQQMAELAEGGRTRITGYEYGAKTGIGGAWMDAIQRAKGTPEATYRYSQQLQSLSGAGGYDAGGGKVVVQNETSLEQLAQRIYGTTQLWYVLADANGLNHDSELIEGASLNAPNVRVNTNDANTFKPYNPGEAIGSTTPGLPYIPPPPKNGCAKIAMVIMIVVAIVVTAVTYGAAAGAMSTMLSSAAAVGAAAGGVTVAGAMAAGFVAGVAGSIASQAIGSAMGVTSFSWRQVAVDGITTAITMGAGAAMANAGKAAVEAGKASRWINEAGKLSTLGRVTQGAITFGGSVVANAAVGRDTNFSWNAVAANVVGSYVSA